MPNGTLNRDYVMPKGDTYEGTTIPKGTRVHLVKGADGMRGDLWAVSSVSLLVNLTGNNWDPHYRYAWVPADAVTQD